MLIVLLKHVRTGHAKTVEHEMHVEPIWRENIHAVGIQRIEIMCELDTRNLWNTKCTWSRFSAKMSGRCGAYTAQ